MRRIIPRAIQVLCAVILVAVFLASFSRVQAYRDNLPFEHVRAEALMVDPTLLQIISGEFKGLVADYLNLKAAIFKGGAYKLKGDDWEVLYTLFKQAIILDPLFFHTGYYTQGILSWRKDYHEKAIEILEIHAENRLWQWEPKFYLGFNHFYYLKDNEAGQRYLQESSHIPGAPPIVASLAARLMQRRGRTLTAIAYLKSMLEQAKDDEIIETLTKRLNAHLGVHQLEVARDAYIRDFGRNPKYLYALVENGYIQEMPENTMFDGFFYNSATGEISFEPQR